jgi:thioredoxin reductase
MYSLQALSALNPTQIFPVLTAEQIARARNAGTIRKVQMLEINLPGVFAMGDVRAGNVKRVASAVGEGAISVHLVHRTLAEL